jgi:hypothetical protein
MPENTASSLPADHDRFFLSHLQSVKGQSYWYYNQRFLGRGGNGACYGTRI